MARDAVRATWRELLMRWLALPFVVVPLVELYLLLIVSNAIGFWPTVGLTLVTGVIGASLAKREGRRVLRGWTQQSANRQAPEVGLVNAALVLVGGVLLITPGVLTDAFGFSLMFPPVRARVAGLIRSLLIDRLARSGLLHATVIQSASVEIPGVQFTGDGRSSHGAHDVVDTSGEPVP